MRVFIQGLAQPLRRHTAQRRGLTGSAAPDPSCRHRGWPCPSPTGLACSLEPVATSHPDPCSVTGGKGNREHRQERKGCPRGDQTALSSQSGLSPASAPLLGKKRTKINLAVIKQLSGNQIIPRTEKPINKGATKTNRTTGAARKCSANTNAAGTCRRLRGEAWALGCSVGALRLRGPQSEDALPWGTPSPMGETQPSLRELPDSLGTHDLCPGGYGY